MLLSHQTQPSKPCKDTDHCATGLPQFSGNPRILSVQVLERCRMTAERCFKNSLLLSGLFARKGVRVGRQL